MTLPSFLIVGAMKAGTTTLYRDLRSNDAVFLPSEKEPHALIHDEVLTQEGTNEYESLFKSATQTQQCGEASTGYTKYPDNEGVPSRARTLLGSELKVIYIVRNPIERLISQYHHEVFVSGLTMQIDEAIHDFPALLNYSKYAMQVELWIQQFSKEQVHIIIFEEYVTNRSKTIDAVCSFLGIQSNASKISDETIYNKGSGRPMRKGPIFAITRTKLYQKCIRPLLPLSARDSLRKNLLAKSPPKAKPSIESVVWAVEQLEQDMEQFKKIINVQELPWDLSSATEQFADA